LRALNILDTSAEERFDCHKQASKAHGVHGV